MANWDYSNNVDRGQKKFESEEAKLEYQIQKAEEHILNRRHRDLLPKIFNLPNLREFNNFLKEKPDIKQRLEQAKIDALEFLEDDVLDVADSYDHKAARVQLEAINKKLQWGDPKRYGNKIDLNLNQTISIKDRM